MSRAKRGRLTVTRQRGGFTLIELLIVITIIGVLMGLLFPAVIDAMKAANETKCQANLKQLAEAMLTYCSDHDGSFPLYPTGTQPGSASDWLYRPATSGGQNLNDFSKGLLLANKYIGNDEILYCPLDMDRGLPRPSGALEMVKIIGTLKESVPAPSYVINQSITWGDYSNWPGGTRGKVRSRNITDFDTNDFMFIEQSAGVGTDLEPESACDQAYMIPNANAYSLTRRHHGGGYVACMGGHVEWISQEAFKEGMQKIGSGGTWYYRTLERPSSTPAGVVSPEEIGSRWNPG